MQSVNSAITGALGAVTQHGLAGREPGTTAASRSVIVSDEIASGWLLAQPNPQAADEALCRSLTSTLAVTASVRTEGRFPSDGPAYRVVVGCDFTVEDPANLPAAISKVRQAMTPASVDQCEGWLVMLQAATAHRQSSDASSAAAYALYASELRQWPADVAKAACERLARGRAGTTGTVWFPTLAELVRECERMAAPRQAMLASLERWHPAPVLPLAHSRGRPTDEDREFIRKTAHEVANELRATAEAKVRAARVDMPSIAGKPDAGGLTPQMRDLMARRGDA